MTSDEIPESSIADLARHTGTTTRALRHYQHVGLLEPSRRGEGGIRFYDRDGLLRLQRILLLRDLGLGLDAIRQVLQDEPAVAPALRTHLGLLRTEQDALARRIAAVEHALHAHETGGPLMAEDMFDGFDHTRYESEVTERWGADAHRTGDAWWRGMDATDRRRWKAESDALAADWRAAVDDGVPPDSDRAHRLAERHIAWLESIPGTPRRAGRLDPEYLAGLVDMYVDDDRFAANYGGTAGAEFVRAAVRAASDQA